jgi:F-type H+-transporting ATPase subunit b
VLRRAVLPRLERVYAERADRIDGGQQRAEVLREQAAAIRQEYDDRIAELRAEAARIRDEARAEGQQVRSELRAAAEAEVEGLRRRGAEQLAVARERAVRELRGELDGLATGLAQRVLGGALGDGARRSAVVAEFLAELDTGRDGADPDRTAPEAGEAAGRPG